MNDWIEHDSTGRPVPQDTLVMLKFRNGDKTTNPSEAGYWVWYNPRREPRLNGYDIVAYRVVSE